MYMYWGGYRFLDKELNVSNLFSKFKHMRCTWPKGDFYKMITQAAHHDCKLNEIILMLPHLAKIKCAGVCLQ